MLRDTEVLTMPGLTACSHHNENEFDGYLHGMDSRIERKPAKIMMLQYLQPLMIPQAMLVHAQFHHPLALSYSVPN